MTRTRLWVGMTVALVVALEAGRLWGAGNPFAKPYTPTALEWLTVTLQADDRVSCEPDAADVGCIDTWFQGHGIDEKADTGGGGGSSPARATREILEEDRSGRIYRNPVG